MPELNIQASHPSLGEVTILRILPQELPVTLKEPPATYEVGIFWPNEDPVTDELYHRTALVVDNSGKKVRIKLRELRLYGKPLIQHVLDHEQIERFKASRITRGEPYLHSHYGLIEVIDCYTKNLLRCRVMSSTDVLPEGQLFTDNVPARHKLPNAKEFTCHTSELIPVEKLMNLQPKDEHLYVAYSDVGAVAESGPAYKPWRRKEEPEAELQPSVTRYAPSARRDDLTMKGIDEFLRVLRDLPRLVKTKKLSGPRGELRTVRYRQSPRVIARGEDTGRLYITPAWWLWRVTGTFKVSKYGEKTAERYRWEDPKGSPPPKSPEWFSYDPESEEYGYDGFLMDLSEIIPDPPLQLMEKNAWYWKLPAKSAREFNISGLNIHWLKPEVDSPLATISLKFSGQEYQVPVYLDYNQELMVRVKSRELAAFLCRYTINKMTTAFHGRPQL